MNFRKFDRFRAVSLCGYGQIHENPQKRPAEVGGVNQTVNRNGGIMNCTPCLSLWERWLSEAKAERAHKVEKPSPSPAVTPLPKGEALAKR